MTRLGVECGVKGRRIDQSGVDAVVAGERELVVKRLHHADRAMYKKNNTS